MPLVSVRDWSLVARVVAICVTIGLTFALVTTAIGYAKASSGLTEQGEARLESDATIVTTAVDNWTAQKLQLVHAVASMPTVVRFLEAGNQATPEDLAYVSQLGEASKANLSDIAGVSVLDTHGIIRASQTAKLGSDFSNRDYFQNAVAGSDFVSGVSVSLADGLPKIFIAVPVRAEDGRIVGVVNANGDPQGLQRLLDAQTARLGVGRGLLLDEQGLVIANTVDPSWLLRPVVPLSSEFLKSAEQDKRWGTNPTPESLGEHGLAPAVGASQRTIFDWKTLGETYHAVALPLSLTHWTYVSALPTSAFEAAAGDLLRTSGLAIAFGLIFALLVAVLTTRPLARGMRTITTAANRLAEGNAEDLVTIASRDEIGQIAAAFENVRDYLGGLADAADRIAEGDLTTDVTPASEHDRLGAAVQRMQARLRDLVGQVQSAAEAVAETSRSVSDSANQAGSAAQNVAVAMQSVAGSARATTLSAAETSSALTQLTQAIDSIAQGAGYQADHVQRAGATATQMADGVDVVARKASRVAAESQRATASAERGADAVRETATGMDAIKAVVVAATGSVNELGALGERIGAVVETIDDIAAQTNLLALNAAIEAARAGDHGRGFAVVADEVRKLAERSSRETQQIAQLISRVQAATREAVDAMRSGAERVEQGSSRANLAAEALQEILAAVTQTVQDVSEIATSADEMAAASRGLVETMESISAVVEENTASTEEMAAQAQQVNAAMQSISTVSLDQSAATDEVTASTEHMSHQVAEMSAQADELSQTASYLRRQVARFRLSAPVENVVELRRAA